MVLCRVCCGTERAGVLAFRLRFCGATLKANGTGCSLDETRLRMSQFKDHFSGHADRLTQVAVGAVDDDPHLQDLVRACFDAAGRAVPVIVERPGPIWASCLSDEVGRLRALSRRFLTPYR